MDLINDIKKQLIAAVKDELIKVVRKELVNEITLMRKKVDELERNLKVELNSFKEGAFALSTQSTNKLELEKSIIVRAECTKSRQDSVPGVVKVELTSTDTKVKALRNKYRLRDKTKFQNVFLHGAKTHEEGLIELNTKELLRNMPERHQWQTCKEVSEARKWNGQTVTAEQQDKDEWNTSGI
ncbi:unnamed protein product [Owenia fusiformis]|uniref:Uncharacterized protein n=1 Tax=Owenia fusiformis TaxID=6347 RepID=A0A8J1TVS3_OWEFU|nr:unnamed protein product [Owenia fusiformis]